MTSIAFFRLGGNGSRALLKAGGEACRLVDLHNPLLKPEWQQTDTRITLGPVGEDFVDTNANGEESHMNGYYQAEVPGLPSAKKRSPQRRGVRDPA